MVSAEEMTVSMLDLRMEVSTRASTRVSTRAPPAGSTKDSSNNRVSGPPAHPDIVPPATGLPDTPTVTAPLVPSPPDTPTASGAAAAEGAPPIDRVAEETATVEGTRVCERASLSI